MTIGANLFPGGMQMPGAAPAMPPQTGFVLQIPADPTWEPFDVPDVLEKDGYYCCKIIKEASRNDSTKSPGVFITLEVQDEDAKGRHISRFLSDPRSAKGNVWFLWRGLMRSIAGSTEGARQGFTYTPGAFTNQFCYVKTERTMRDDRLVTDVDTWITKDEYVKAVQNNSHRWAPKAVQTGPGGTVGMLPGGAPAGFPGLPGGPTAGGFPLAGGLPGAPTVPGQPMAAPTTPQPGAAPMQAAPQQQYVPPAAAAPAPAPMAFPGMAPPPVVAAPVAAAPMAFPGMGQQPPQQQMAAPAPAPVAAPVAPAPMAAPAPVAPGTPFSFAQFPGQPTAPAVNGAAPTAAGLVTSFPGTPPQQ